MSNFTLCKLNYYCWKYLYGLIFFIILMIFLSDIPANVFNFTTVDGLLIGSVFLAGIGYYLHKKIESKYCEGNKLYNIWKQIDEHNNTSSRKKQMRDWSIKRDQLQQQYDYELKNNN